MNTHILRKTLLAMCLISGLMFVFNGCSDDEEETKTQVTALTFEDLDIKEAECGQHFTRDNMALTLESSYGHEGECGSSSQACCFLNEIEPVEDFNIERGSLWICTGRLVVDLTQLGTIEKISVTLGDWGHNRVALYDSESNQIAFKENTDVATMETLIFDTQLDNVHSVVVSGCEGLVKNITIEHQF
nr:hypothetical protein [uncultured Draconibacterium sp.]